jgi:hypothetical protein
MQNLRFAPARQRDQVARTELVNEATQGVQLATMQKLARYWGKDHDWRKARRNSKPVPHFITEIDGLDIHFIHVRSKHENALPMIVTHGWPGSIIEQTEDHRTAERIRLRMAVLQKKPSIL